jgi:hypothetical protein
MNEAMLKEMAAVQMAERLARARQRRSVRAAERCDFERRARRAKLAGTLARQAGPTAY